MFHAISIPSAHVSLGAPEYLKATSKAILCQPKAGGRAAHEWVREAVRLPKIEFFLHGQIHRQLPGQIPGQLAAIMPCKICKKPGHNSITCVKSAPGVGLVGAPDPVPAIAEEQPIIADIANYIRSLSKEDALIACSALIPVIHEVGKKHDHKLFDNYGYRTFAMYNEVRRGVWDDIELNTKRTGVDATSDKYGLEDIEFKTCNDDKAGNPLKTSFMWDKQSEEVRRTKTLESDAFVLGRFESEYLTVILVGREPAALEHIRTVMKDKQEKFLVGWNNNIKNGKRGGSDAIRLNYEDLLCGVSAVSAAQPHWDIWQKGVWYKSLTGEECRNVLSSSK
jgi:hypothetical protein